MFSVINHKGVSEVTSSLSDPFENVSENPEVRSEFTGGLIRYLLATRVGRYIRLRDYVDTENLAGVVVEVYRRLVRRDQTRRLIAEGINASLNSAETLEGSLRDVLPDEITDHLKQLVGREYRANRDLIQNFVEHPTMRTVIRNVLQETLREFVERTSDWIEESGSLPGMKGARNLFLNAFGMARSFTKRFSEAYEQRIEERIGSFVDEMIDEAIDNIVLQLTSEEMVPKLSDWRRDLVDVLLDQPIRRYLEELRKFDPDESLDDLGEIFLVIGEWDQSPDLVEALLTSALQQLEDQTIGEVLEIVGMRKTVESKASQILSEGIASFSESSRD